ncbi:MAG: hypothetical protein EBR30_24035 [Cytophagia bacterium]|jgi:hypothetical protein|nr:hypothetical protein [Cytophagia bacterium]
MNKMRYKFKVGQLVKIKAGAKFGSYAFVLSREHGERKWDENNYSVMVQGVETVQWYTEHWLEKAE